ncbi:HAD family hydrolase [Pseudomonas antarctica]|uniref:HAD family hydrolase n=1 Tax=Pseudomonas antarctica TaxID=219572 RepID=UPI003F756F11
MTKQKEPGSNSLMNTQPVAPPTQEELLQAGLTDDQRVSREDDSDSSGRPQTSFIFDLDGTLTDSVYQNVAAWKQALDAENIPLAMWRIHRKIGMSGGLMLKTLSRETGVEISDEQGTRLSKKHAEAYASLKSQITALPGAVELLKTLTQAKMKWCIATSGGSSTAQINLKALGLDINQINIVTRDDVKYGKPDPDLFLAAARKLEVPIEECVVVGDAVWDMLAARRCKATGVGLLSGGYDISELERAGALRVYEDPLGLLQHLEEIATRP